MDYVRIFQQFGEKENGFTIVVKRDGAVESKVFDNTYAVSHYIRISLEIDQDAALENHSYYSINDISFVKYVLPPNFKDRIRVSKSSDNNFELRIWSYGYFEIKAIVYPKYARSFEITKYLSFPVSEEDRKKNIDLAKQRDENREFLAGDTEVSGQSEGLS